MLKALGFDSLDAADGRRRARRDPVRRRARPARPVDEEEAVAELRALAARNHAARADDRARLPRHRHPGGDPPQRARGPVLVHRLHAVPAGDLAGPARGAAQLPDDGRRPDRAADRQRVAARRGHRRRRGDDAGAARQPQGDGRVRRRRRRAAADDRGGRAPAPRRWASRSSSPTWPTGCPTGDVCGVLVQYPGASGAGARPAPGHRGGPRARRPGRGRRRPARADAAGVAGHARRRRRGRHHPAVRRAAVLRRSARRLHGGPQRARAAPAGPARRRLGRRRGAAGVPARAADPRAAHPPRQGDLEHLHRPGPAGRGRRDVRRLPRPRGAPRDRPRRRTARRAGCAAALGDGGRRASLHDDVLRHAAVQVPGRAAEVVAAAREAGVHLRQVDDDHVGISVSETTRERAPRARCWRRSAAATALPRRRDVALPCRRAAAHHRLPHPRGVPHAPLRDVDAALPLAAVAPRLRARPRDDPARLVHDEAQRHHGDGADQPARVREPAPVRPGRRRARLPGADRAARGRGWPR